MFNSQNTKHEFIIFTSGSFYKFALLLLILGLQYETIPLPIKAQIMPFTSVLALLFFIFTIDSFYKTPVFMLFAVWFIYGLFHSTIMLVIDLFRFNGEPLRFFSWLRQLTTFIIAGITFWVFRYLMRYVDEKFLCYSVVLLSIPSIIIGFINALWGLLNLSFLGEIVIFLRNLFAPYGYISKLRSSGLSLEPSTYAGFLGLIIFPFGFLLWRYNKILSSLIILLAVVSFIWTFSLSGFILVAFMSILGLMFFAGKRKFFFIFLVLIVLLFIIVISVFPWSQIVRHLGSIFVGGANISLTDRLYSTVGPFIQSFSSLVIVGYGIGGVGFHLDEILPKEVYFEIVRSGIRWEEFANLGTLIGRIYSEMGLIGLFLFLMIFFIAFQQLNMILKNTKNQKAFYQTAFVILGGLLLTLAYLFGSYHNPYIWFWLSIIDKKYYEMFER